MTDEVQHGMDDMEEKSFPLKALPVPIQEFIRNLYEFKGFPKAYTAASVLYATSVAIGNSIVLYHPRIFDHIHCNITVAIVGERGTNKSAPIRSIIKPLYDMDHLNVTEFNNELKKHKSKITSGEKEEEPIAKRIIVSNITTESLMQKLNENKRGLGLAVDELISWLNSFDMYRKGKSGNDESLFLNLYNCSTITVDRKTQKEIISIKNPFLSIIGSIQPQVLYKAVSGNRIENGFFDRILYAINDSDKVIEWETNEMEDKYSQIYNEMWTHYIKQLYNMSVEIINKDSEQVITLTTEALQTLNRWRDTFEKDNKYSASNDEIALFSKIQIQALRLIIIINALKNVCGSIKNILLADKDTVLSAICIATWFYENGKKVLVNIVDTSQIFDKHKKFIEALPNKFRTKEAYTFGENQGISHRTVDSILSKLKGTVFTCEASGHYEKNGKYRKDEP